MGSDSDTSTSNVSNNVVTLNDTRYSINGTNRSYPTSIGNIYGGIIGSYSDNDIVGGYAAVGNIANNTLNVYGMNLTANNVYNFDTMNFYIPSTATSGDTMLTLTDTSGTDVSGVSINAGVMGDSSLRSGDTINLLTNSNSLNANSSTTYGKLSEGVSLDYDLSISQRGTSIVATIGDVSSEVTTSPSNNTITLNNSNYSINGTSASYPRSIGNIYGGITSSYSDNDIVGGYSSSGNISNNTLNVYGMNLTANNVYNFDTMNFYIPNAATNGSTMLTLTDSDGTDVSGVTINAGILGGSNLTSGDTINLLTNNNGMISNSATTYGRLNEGISLSYDLEVTNLGNSIIARLNDIKADASGNTVTLNDSNYSINGTTSSYPDEIGNIYGGTNSSYSDNDIVGGYSSSSSEISNNTLNVYGSNLNADNIYNFDRINFYIPNTVTSGDTMLTLSDSRNTDLNGVAINAGILGGSSLSNGDTINLITNTDGMILTNARTTYGTLSEGISLYYNLAVEKVGNNTIRARIANVRDSVLYGAGRPSNNSISINDNSYTINGNTISYSGTINNVFGGHSFSDGTEIMNGINIEGGNYDSGDSSGNSLDITGGNIENLYGGYSPDGDASNNTLNMKI